MVEAAGVGLHAMIHSTQLIEFPFHPILRKLCTRPIQVRKRYADVVSDFGPTRDQCAFLNAAALLRGSTRLDPCKLRSLSIGLGAMETMLLLDSECKKPDSAAWR
jgi:hypothetical protein